MAMKRLRIISDHTELGSGFKIALKDLEIRGAGNILGREQHGYILSVGYDLYLKMLDEAVAALSRATARRPRRSTWTWNTRGIIPDSYIPDAMEKMEVYKKIAGVTTEEEFDRVYREIEDRFGPVPDEVHSVLALAEIRIICRRLFITSIKEEKGTLARRVLTPVQGLRGQGGADGEGRAGQGHPGSRRSRMSSSCGRAQSGLREKSEFLRERLSMLT